MFAVGTGVIAVAVAVVLLALIIEDPQTHNKPQRPRPRRGDEPKVR
jgi:hypothetical protein